MCTASIPTPSPTCSASAGTWEILHEAFRWLWGAFCEPVLDAPNGVPPDAGPPHDAPRPQGGWAAVARELQTPRCRRHAATSCSSCTGPAGDCPTARLRARASRRTRMFWALPRTCVPAPPGRCPAPRTSCSVAPGTRLPEPCPGLRCPTTATGGRDRHRRRNAGVAEPQVTGRVGCPTATRCGTPSVEQRHGRRTDGARILDTDRGPAPPGSPSVNDEHPAQAARGRHAAAPHAPSLETAFYATRENDRTHRS